VPGLSWWTEARWPKLVRQLRASLTIVVLTSKPSYDTSGNSVRIRLANRPVPHPTSTTSRGVSIHAALNQRGER
jgi:hypothetical protein